MIYIVGYREHDLTKEEQNKLTEHVNKWSIESWAKDKYAPFDNRDEKFETVANTFAHEYERNDNKKIVIYDDLEVVEGDKNKVLNAYNELKSLFPDVTFEAHTDVEKLD